MLTLTEEQLAAIQQRIAKSTPTRTVRHMQTEQEAAIGAKTSAAAKKRNGGKKQVGDQAEAVVLRECSEVLDKHPKIAFWWRVNTGAALTTSGRFVKFSFVGASDLMAMSVTGRFIAVECKATGKKPTGAQMAFLDNVNDGGGFGVCVDHAGMLALALREL